MEQTKKCSRCKQIKEVSEFSKDISKKDRLRIQCKDCDKAYSQTDKCKAYRKAFGETYQKAYRQTEAGKAAQRRGAAKQRAKDPDKIKAQKAANHAVTAGKLPRPDSLECSCGNQAKQYHHPDYFKPLEVVPKCIKCHRKIHC